MLECVDTVQAFVGVFVFAVWVESGGGIGVGVPALHHGLPYVVWCYRMVCPDRVLMLYGCVLMIFRVCLQECLRWVGYVLYTWVTTDCLMCLLMCHDYRTWSLYRSVLISLCTCLQQ